METPEGKGIARRAWEAYVGVINRTITPSLAPYVVEPVARQVVEDLIGFWVLWHLYGGFEGLERWGMHPSTIWRKVARFRKVYGKHPDEFEIPGIKIDPKAYWANARKQKYMRSK